MKAKKSLGQNFLNNKHYVNRAIEAASLQKNDTVLEIGPGKGFLTDELLRTAKYVVAIEKDDDLYAELSQKYQQEIKEKKLELIHEDILEINLEKKGLKDGSYKVIANIPYNITGLIITKFLECSPRPNLMVLMTQKEVAERIVSKDGKESILSISVKAFCIPKYITTVKSGNFSPRPKVDSALLGFFEITDKLHSHKSDFFELLKAGFSQKRKKLLSNLENHYKIELVSVFSRLNIDENTRAEKLSFENWLSILKEITE